jgi:hypothetical protein
MRLIMKLSRRWALPLLTIVIATAPAASQVSGRLQDKRLREASGLAASRLVDGRFWAINDSGNAPILFALDANGSALGRVRVANTLNRDWEALGSGPCPVTVSSADCLYIGDVGDNEANRTDIRIEIVVEPLPGNVSSVTPARTLTITFEEGPRDVETLLVHPKTGDLFLVEKLKRAALGNPAPLYQVIVRDTSNATIARRVGSVGATTRSGQSVGRITDGGFLPDGRSIALRDLERTYKAIWPPNQGVLSLSPFPSPQLPQAEALAVSADGKSVLVTSEGQGSAIAKVVLPD